MSNGTGTHSNWLVRGLHEFIDKYPYATAFCVASCGLISFTVAHKVQFLNTHPTVRLVAEHLAMAIIIAGIVGFGYELSGHARRMKAIVTELREQSDDVLIGFERMMSNQLDAFDVALRERLSEFTELVDKEALAALPRAFAKLFDKTPADAHLEDRSLELYTSLRAIHVRQSWIDNISLRFVGELLGYASRNAQKLARVSVKDDDPLTLQLPISSAVLAGEILAAEMDGLARGDSYLVVTDFGSWAWPPEIVFAKESPAFSLHKFYDSTVAAVNEKRGVVVKRLFSKFNRDRVLTQAQAESILARHWEVISQASRGEDGFPRYQIAILPRSAWEAIGQDAFHRGMFIHGDESLCFMPLEPYLDKMQFQMLPVPNDHIANFDYLWKQAVRSSDRDANGEVVTRSFAEMIQLLGPRWWEQ